MGKKEEYKFEISPEAITNDQLVEIVEGEVVVVGAGTAGLVCANSAAENGLRVIFHIRHTFFSLN